MASSRQIFERMRRTVSAIARDRNVDGFYVGRTVDMEARGIAHGADDILCLHETESVDRALDLEDDLINAVYDPKNLNIQDHCGGGVGEGTQHLYVAIKYK